MADSPPYTKTHTPFSEFSSRIQPKPIDKGKSCTSFLFKVLILALFVVVVPLFPSQAPDFVNQTALTKFWELIHLLFIGVAVAYGLFSRRNVDLETDIDTQPSVDVNTSYVSIMFPVSTIFNNGCENPCGYDEKRMIHCWNPQYGDPGLVCHNGGAVGVFDEQYKAHLPMSQDNFSYSFRYDGTNVVQAWNSENHYSEQVVVVAQPCYTIGECGEPVGYKPLGLPVRSLRSVAGEVDGPKQSNESDSSSGSRGSSKGLHKSRDKGFGDLGPSNLEKNFDAAAAAAVGGSANPIPWRSRTRRREREKRHGNVTRPSHFRPLSVDESKFEALGSRSLQSTTSFSSHTRMYASFNSISSDNMIFQEEELGEKEASYVPASEKMNFEEKTMGPKKNAFVPASEIMNFKGKDMGQRMASYVPAFEDMNFKGEDMGQRMTSYVPAFENMNFQEVDLGKNICQGSSVRNGRMAIKGKHAAASYPSHFRPMSVDETQFELLSSQSFQSGGSFSSHTSMYSSLESSDNMNFREEDVGQKKTLHVHASENMNFQEVDMGQNKTFYVHPSEDGNFQEENSDQNNASYVPASENMDFQDANLAKISQGSSSRNGRMETEVKYAAVSHPSHLRPLSVDETQFESFSSRSFQSVGSLSPRPSLCSSLDSVSSENVNSQKEDFGENKTSHGSFSNSPSPLARRNHVHGYSNSSMLQDDIKSNLNDDLRALNEMEGEDPPGSKDSRVHRLQSDSEKPAKIAKALSRGKSVRTRRASGLVSGQMKIGELSSKQTDEKIEKKPKNAESVLMRKEKMKSVEPDFLLKGIGKKTLNTYFPEPDVTFSNDDNRDKQEPSKNVSEENSDIELENTEVSLDDDVDSECVNDSRLDSEVDRKASEFIARFKAQIRLQKTVSIENAKGKRPMETIN